MTTGVNLNSLEFNKTYKGCLLNSAKGDRAVKGGWPSPIEGRPLVDVDDIVGGGI